MRKTAKDTRQDLALPVMQVKGSLHDLVLAGKEATTFLGGLAQSKVTNMVTDLAAKVSTAALTSGPWGSKI